MSGEKGKQKLKRSFQHYAKSGNRTCWELRTETFLIRICRPIYFSKRWTYDIDVNGRQIDWSGESPTYKTVTEAFTEAISQLVNYERQLVADVKRALEIEAAHD